MTKNKLIIELTTILIFIAIGLICFKFWNCFIGIGILTETWILSHYWIFKYFDKLGKERNDREYTGETSKYSKRFIVIFGITDKEFHKIKTKLNILGIDSSNMLYHGVKTGLYKLFYIKKGFTYIVEVGVNDETLKEMTQISIEEFLQEPKEKENV